MRPVTENMTDKEHLASTRELVTRAIPLQTTGAPTVSSSFLGQDALSATGQWYKSITIGNGAADWVVSSGVTGITQLTGDGTAGPGTGSKVFTNVNAPGGFTHAGSVVTTAIAAPATPAAGKATQYIDSTSKNFASKDDAGNVNHGVRTKAAVASNWLRSIADDGSTTASQPAFTDVSGSATTAQLGTNTATNAVLAQMATLTIKGNNTGGTANALDLTVAQVVTMLGIGNPRPWLGTVTGAGPWTFSGLTGDASDTLGYELVLRINKAAAGVHTLAVQFNGDTGANYVDTTGIPTTSARLHLSALGAGSESFQGVVRIPVSKSGFSRVLTGQVLFSDGVVGATKDGPDSAWLNTANAMTSISVINTAGAVDASSTVDLFILKRVT